MNEKTGKVYDPQVYTSKQWAERMVKEGPYYAALHQPVVVNLKDAMESWLKTVHDKQGKKKPLYDVKMLQTLEVDEALIICQFLRLWKMDKAADVKKPNRISSY